MSAVRNILNSPYFFWALLALPSVPLSIGFIRGTMPYGELMHVSGEFSARFMIIALMVTPLMVMFPANRWPRWLLARRRYLGVAAFGYAGLHTLAYLVEIGVLSASISEIAKLGIWTGWIAFVVFVPLALTSNDAAVRGMGRSWKTLQRLVYVAALFTLAHWMFIHNSFAGALVHFAPLALLEVYRVWKRATPVAAAAE
jgi:sulfoxide reductase heme-binding subunit YedZ